MSPSPASRQPRFCRAAALLAALACFAGTTFAGACTDNSATGGPLGIDRCDEAEARGLTSRANQKRLDALLIGGTVGLALWDGTTTERGRMAWTVLDSMATTAVATEVMKNLFQRPRPAQIGDPDLWRQGHGFKSFPSGETAMTAAFVTPLIRRYADESPAVWALAALPVYMGVARMRSQGHWLSDVLAGGAVGVGVGLVASDRQTPWLLLPTGDGVFVGFRQRW